jgi:hypothetical protein
VQPTVPNEMDSSRMGRNLYFFLNSICVCVSVCICVRARHRQLAGLNTVTRRGRAMLGRSAIAPSFSKMPSVTIKRRAALLALLLDGDEYVLEAPGVVVVVTADGRARDLEALLDRKVDAAVGDNQVVRLSERGDDRGDRREDCE